MGHSKIHKERKYKRRVGLTGQCLKEVWRKATSVPFTLLPMNGAKEGSTSDTCESVRPGSVQLIFRNASSREQGLS